MRIVRQNTSFTHQLGPVVDSTDASAETGQTPTAADIGLSKNGGAFAAKNSGGATHTENGFYTATFSATDTDTVGHLRVAMALAGTLHVYEDFMVMEEAIFDSLYGPGAAQVPANVVQISGNTDAADNLEDSCLTLLTGTFTGTPTTTTGSDTARAEVSDDHFIGRRIYFLGSENSRAAYASSKITDYVGATNTFTWEAITTAPNAGDGYLIV